MEKSWKAAIIKVLGESDAPMHYSDISEQILSRGHYQTDGATPAATVNAQIATSIKHEGDKSPFARVGKGIFALKTALTASVPITAEAIKPNGESVSDMETSDSIIRSFGMYWQRDLVVWRSEPKLFGKQQAVANRLTLASKKASTSCTTITPWFMSAGRSIGPLGSGFLNIRWIALAAAGTGFPGSGCWMQPTKAD